MTDHILFAILAELDSAKAKHPEFPTCNVKRAAIMIEGGGEVIREANSLDEDKGDLNNLRIELIQTAAMCLRMLEAMQNECNKESFYTNNL